MTINYLVLHNWLRQYHNEVSREWLRSSYPMDKIPEFLIDKHPHVWVQWRLAQ